VAEAVVEEIRAAGGTAVASTESVATPEGGAAIVQRAVDAFGRLDAVVSNAGIFYAFPFEDLTFDDWDRMRRVLYDGSFCVAQPAFRIMKRQGYGRFVFITSSSGLFGRAETSHYGAAKAGVLGLSHVIALEGRAHGILANNVLPYGITRMVTDEPSELDPTSFLGRIHPELVVPIVTYLASRACELTHQSFTAAAGWFGRAFIGLGEGWAAPPGTPPTAEDIAAHLDAVTATEPHAIPRSIDHEAAHIARRLPPD
jgi:NAD(P)-dependent dehydrogenase (short-subunit alcohol dehydrogenase family)